jgi:hypothetical protein
MAGLSGIGSGAFAQQWSTSVLRRSLDLIRQQGQQAVQLLESASAGGGTSLASPAPSAPPAGSTISIRV